MRVRKVDQLELSRPHTQPTQPPEAPHFVRTDDLIRGLERVRGHGEDPLRAAELGGHRTQRLDAPILSPVEIPPAAAIRYEIEFAAGGPLRLKDRLGRPAGHAFTTRDRAVASEGAQPQLCAVPRHVRLGPAQPGQPSSVWAQARGGVKVTAGGGHGPRLTTS